MSDLIKRIDGWQYDVPADMKLHALLNDCRAEIQRLLTANEALKGLCEEYQAEIKQLEVNHEFSKVINLGLRSQNESLDAECARLESLREYVPMTDDEWGKMYVGDLQAYGYQVTKPKLTRAHVTQRCQTKMPSAGSIGYYGKKAA